MTRIPWLTAAVALVSLWAVMLWPRYQSPHRDRRDCEAAQRLYDSQLALIQYVADSVTGSPASTDLKVESLREELGPRPVC